jgi:hypothetical protein
MTAMQFDFEVRQKQVFSSDVRPPSIYNKITSGHWVIEKTRRDNSASSMLFHMQTRLLKNS